MILAALIAMGVAGLLSAVMSDLAGALLMALVIGLTSNAAKQAFDSIVQRDAPDANRGRAFAKFETRFQLWWVVGALVPVVFGSLVSPNLGFLLIGLGTAAGAIWYAITRQRLAAAMRRRPTPFSDEPVLVEPRPVSRSFLRGGRARTRATRDAALATADGDELAEVPPASAGVSTHAPARTGYGGYDETVVGPGEGVALAEAASPPPPPMVPVVSPDGPTVVQGRAFGADEPTEVQRPPPPPPPAPAAPAGPSHTSGGPRAHDEHPARWQSRWDGGQDPTLVGWGATAEGHPAPSAPPAAPRHAPAVADLDDELGFGGSDAALFADLARPPASGLFAPEPGGSPSTAAPAGGSPMSPPAGGSPMSPPTAASRPAAPSPPRHDPGPPSLVPPAPIEPAHDPYAGPADAVPPSTAGRHPARLPLVAPDGSYPDIPWRDSVDQRVSDPDIPWRDRGGPTPPAVDPDAER
jgi:hypothetical protein